MKTPHHTVLFNISSRTILKLNPDQEKAVWNEIEDTMNGDGLYEGSSKEIILEAYYDQHARSWDTSQPDKNWVELIQEVLHWMGRSNETLPQRPVNDSIRVVCQNTLR
jgi:hypothetical protein